MLFCMVLSLKRCICLSHLDLLISDRPTHVCKLHKSLYGLKQAPRAWFHRLTTHLLNLGFHSSKADSSLFIYSRAAVQLYVLIYVDDILITGTSSSMVSSLIGQLGQEFSIKYLGSIHYFLGVEVVPHSKGILLSQKKYSYILDILSKTGMSDSKGVHTHPCHPRLNYVSPVALLSMTLPIIDRWLGCCNI